jgi:hypothetical protein
MSRSNGSSGSLHAHIDRRPRISTTLLAIAIASSLLTVPYASGALVRDQPLFGSSADVEAHYVQRYFPAQRLYLETVRAGLARDFPDSISRTTAAIYGTTWLDGRGTRISAHSTSLATH